MMLCELTMPSAILSRIVYVPWYLPDGACRRGAMSMSVAGGETACVATLWECIRTWRRRDAETSAAGGRNETAGDAEPWWAGGDFRERIRPTRRRGVSHRPVSSFSPGHWEVVVFNRAGS